MEERLFNTLSMVNEEMAGVSIATKKKTAKEIAELIQSEYVEKEFIEWIFSDSTFSRSLVKKGVYINLDSESVPIKYYTLDEVHDCWLTNVKNKDTTTPEFKTLDQQRDDYYNNRKKLFEH